MIDQPFPALVRAYPTRQAMESSLFVQRRVELFNSLEPEANLKLL